MKLQSKLVIGIGLALVLLAVAIVSSTARMSNASAQTSGPAGQPGIAEQNWMVDGWQSGGVTNGSVGYWPGDMMRHWLTNGEMLGRRMMGSMFGNATMGSWMGGWQNNSTPVPGSGRGRNGGMMGGGMCCR